MQATLKPGQRVVMSAEGRQAFPNRRAYTARFVRYIRPRVTTAAGRMILVHVDGYANPERFHESFWGPRGRRCETPEA